jgi:hypothetical protein
MFIEFDMGHRTIIAIVQPRDGQSWIDVPHPPMLLSRAVALEAVDVRNILAPAGRIEMSDGKNVAFETSTGGIEPELVDDEDEADGVNDSA